VRPCLIGKLSDFCPRAVRFLYDKRPIFEMLVASLGSSFRETDYAEDAASIPASASAQWRIAEVKD